MQNAFAANWVTGLFRFFEMPVFTHLLFEQYANHRWNVNRWNNLIPPSLVRCALDIERERGAVYIWMSLPCSRWCAEWNRHGEYENARFFVHYSKSYRRQDAPLCEWAKSQLLLCTFKHTKSYALHIYNTRSDAYTAFSSQSRFIVRFALVSLLCLISGKIQQLRRIIFGASSIVRLWFSANFFSNLNFSISSN